MPNATRTPEVVRPLVCPGCGQDTTDVYPVARITVGDVTLPVYGCAACAVRLVERPPNTAP